MIPMLTKPIAQLLAEFDRGAPAMWGADDDAIFHRLDETVAFVVRRYTVAPPAVDRGAMTTRLHGGAVLVRLPWSGDDRLLSHCAADRPSVVVNGRLDADGVLLLAVPVPAGCSEEEARPLVEQYLTALEREVSALASAAEKHNATLPARVAAQLGARRVVLVERRRKRLGEQLVKLDADRAKLVQQLADLDAKPATAKQEPARPRRERVSA